MKKYIVESWTKIRREYSTLKKAKEVKELCEKNKEKDIVIIEVETTEKTL